MHSECKKGLILKHRLNKYAYYTKRHRIFDWTENSKVPKKHRNRLFGIEWPLPKKIRSIPKKMRYRCWESILVPKYRFFSVVTVLLIAIVFYDYVCFTNSKCPSNMFFSNISSICSERRSFQEMLIFFFIKELQKYLHLQIIAKFLWAPM